MIFPGVFVANADGDSLKEVISNMDIATRAWESRAARGECAWICADCCVTFPDGMPDECEWGHSSCTEIIVHDKIQAIDPLTFGGPE